MSALTRSVLFFVLAGLMEIGGGYLMWLWLRERWAWWVGAALCVIGIMYAPREGDLDGFKQS